MNKNRQHKRFRQKLTAALGIGLALSITGMSTPVQAASVTWIGSSSWWDYGSNWDSGSQPAPGDDVYLTQSDATNRVVSYYNTLYPNTTDILNSLTINATGTGTMKLEQTSYVHPLYSNNEYIGSTGSGAYVQSVSTNSAGYLYLGYNAGGNGSYNLSGTGTLSTGTISIGNLGTGVMNISGGGTAQSSNSILGVQNYANGTAAINGTGSSWNSGSTLTVGDLGTGTMTINTGAVVSNSTGIVGGGTTGSGTVSVSDVGSKWNNNGNLLIGKSGTGILNINNGARVNSVIGVIANASTGNGAVSVTGTGSTWYNSSNLRVGDSASGTLNINNGGKVYNAIGTVGNYTGSNGTVNIDGSGSLWKNYNSLTIGRQGAGSMNISNGADVINSDGYLGYSGGINGIVTVTDAGSSWTNNGIFRAGFYGTGVLNIENGATVTTGDAILGYGNGSNGKVTVSGTGSNWKTLGNLNVGYAGTGTLNIKNGGTVTNGLGYVRGLGTATITGAGSSWSNSGLLSISGGTLNVLSGGMVNVGTDLHVYSGVVNLTGGTINTGILTSEGSFNFNAGTLNIASDLTLDSTGPLGNDLILKGYKTLGVGGTTTLNGYSTLLLDGGVFSTGSLINNGGFSFNSGTFNLTGDNLMIGAGGLFGPITQFNYGQTMNVSNTTTINNGAVLALNNSRFSAAVTDNNGQITLAGQVSSLSGGSLNNAGMVTGNGQISALLNNTVSGETRVENGNTLSLTAAGNNNDGRITLLGGSLNSSQGLSNNSSGMIAGYGVLTTGSTTATGLNNQGALAFSGRTDIIGDVNNTGTGSIVISGGATATFYDDVVHNGSEIRVSNGSQAVFFGAVSGAGAYTGTGSVFFEGDLLPGNSPALITVEGDMTLGQNSLTTLELGGLLKGDEYDSFSVTGNLMLAGALDVVLFDSGSGLFEPSIGDSFDLFTAETISGNFDLITLAALGAGINWELNYLTDYFGTTDVLRLSAVATSTVPIPASAWLFASGLLGLISIARRKA